MELANCGEMDLVTPDDSGRKKSEAVAVALRAISRSGVAVHEVGENATSFPAVLAAKDADFLISCVDNPAARLTVSILSQLFLKPMLDIGTGILPSRDRGRRMGADVRLVLPGCCLECLGGLRLGEAATGMRDTGRTEVDWRSQRAGSLRSLNMVAVGMALRLLEDFLGGAAAGNTWISLNYDGGSPSVSSPSSVPVTDCPICSLAGLGDAGLKEVPDLLERLKRGVTVSRQAIA
jgi:hypothetical protein